ncbi:MAG: hypothetical protein GW775_03460 [Candidatus Magasanikbacteria bacterium]|uniref:Uncharacterized protein n=1 Tax=Candidatus Magasanikbacteria bacterium CG10_big_fil_rev_8_21_14_0_10_38_6 TaxID=1974647 RepID=A0A2M6NZP3_9BACT|nr:hypothetical protein [Candidatus Magasanikbacteria bacterium]PIR76917.1 MAG: hypothetical protein COU30_05300 [Candidatus Magasanikbacteria bacterium CG10_big_fil_rev_8_21_14_0_10_38_6]
MTEGSFNPNDDITQEVPVVDPFGETAEIDIDELRKQGIDPDHETFTGGTTQVIDLDELLELVEQCREAVN